MKKTSIWVMVLVFSLVNFFGCSSKNVRKASQEENLKEGVVKETTLILATTTSTQDTGLLDVLVEEFEKLFDIKVKVIAVGTGEALKMGERGDADVLLVHAKDAEEKLVDDSYGLYRKDVMHNFSIVVGPPDDPAGIKGMNDAIEAFKMIYDSKNHITYREAKSSLETAKTLIKKIIDLVKQENPEKDLF